MPNQAPREPTSEPIDWSARNAALVAADGEEWDRLSEAFDADWKAAYTTAFVEHAVSRGWKRENAESWPEHMVDDALIDGAPKHEWCPVMTAQADVIEVELESANA